MKATIEQIKGKTKDNSLDRIRASNNGLTDNKSHN